jgi:hypothetical protein
VRSGAIKDGFMRTDNYEHNARSVLFLFVKVDSGVTDVSFRELQCL